MDKNAAITIRLPVSLKRRIESRAVAAHRSLSAQVVAELERVSEEQGPPPGTTGEFLGLYSGSALPAEGDIVEVRRLLWGRLGRHA